MALTVLACYDVADDGRRARVSARLQRYGDRIQRSVFVCTVGPEELEQLVAEVSGMIDLEADAFFVARQCAGCWASHTAIGQMRPPEPVLHWAVF